MKYGNKLNFRQDGFFRKATVKTWMTISYTVFTCRSNCPWIIKIIPHLWLVLKHYTAVSTKVVPQKCKSIGNNVDWSLGLLDWGSSWFSNKEREKTNTCVCAVSFHYAETPWGLLKQPQKPPLPEMTFDVVA